MLSFVMVTLTQSALEEIMKFNFKGKAYRKEVSQRIALFEARQPPFNDIPADFGGGVVGGGEGGGGGVAAVAAGGGGAAWGNV